MGPLLLGVISSIREWDSVGSARHRNLEDWPQNSEGLSAAAESRKVSRLQGLGG